jgi:hypothetical protein
MKATSVYRAIDLVTKIDGEEFRKQKKFLFAFCQLKEGDSITVAKSDLDAVEGITRFYESVTDYLVEIEHRKDVLLNEEDD